MDPSSAQSASAQSSCVFTDGFGSRLVQPDPYQPDADVEVLAFHATVAANAAFAKALGRRVALLSNVRHTMFAHVRRLDRPSEDSLQLVSDYVSGWRLSQVLAVCERHKVAIDIRAVLNLLRQLVPAVALYSRRQREMAIGTVGPDRLILTPQAHLVIAEHGLGPALDTLRLDRDGLWRSFRVVLPNGEAHLSARADVLGVGVVALSLLRGRLLRDDEFPAALGTLLREATECHGDVVRPLSAGLSDWLTRALQLDPAKYFESPQAAQIAFEEMLADERDYVTTPAYLGAFVARYVAMANSPVEETPSDGERQPDQNVWSAVDAPVDAASTEQNPNAVTDAAPEPAPEAAVAETTVPSVGHASRQWSTRVLAALVLLVVTEAVVIAWLWQRSAAALIRQGELVVQSRPTAARVMVDDDMMGTTPVTVRLSPGAYTVKVQAGTSEPRVLVVQIRAGVQTAQYLELQPGK